MNDDGSCTDCSVIDPNCTMCTVHDMSQCESCISGYYLDGNICRGILKNKYEKKKNSNLYKIYGKIKNYREKKFFF